MILTNEFNVEVETKDIKLHEFKHKFVCNEITLILLIKIMTETVDYIKVFEFDLREQHNQYNQSI